MSNWLQYMSWEEARDAFEAAKGVVIVPVGSTEQHSLHLPVGTDSFVAITLAEDAAAKTGAVIAPPVWYGWSPHHMVRPGTTVALETASGEAKRYTILGEWDNDLEKGIISNKTRLAENLLGKKPGDSVEITDAEGVASTAKIVAVEPISDDVHAWIKEGAGSIA